jgi:hypothetical protein
VIPPNVEKLILKASGGNALAAKELAVVAEFFWQTQIQRLAADKVAAELKADEYVAQEIVIAQLRLQEISAIGSDTVILELRHTYEPRVTDWSVYWKYVLKTKDLSLVERRPGKAAIKERWEDGKEIPGVDKFPVYKLSKRKVA